MIGLTLRQLELYHFITAHVKAHGVMPSRTEMRVALGLNSRGTMHWMLQALYERGVLVYDDRRAGSFKLPEAMHQDLADCRCAGCVRVVHRQMVAALSASAPVLGRSDNLRPIRAETLAALLDQPDPQRFPAQAG